MSFGPHDIKNYRFQDHKIKNVGKIKIVTKLIKRKIRSL